ncbi:MAG: ABC-2 family transporter protein [Acidobacteriota bacterium]
MLRYLRLYACFVRFSLSRAMEFRVDFFFRVVMDIVFYAVHLAFFTVLYRHTEILGGWDLDQIYVFAAGLFVIDALQMTIFSNNLWWLPIFINRGDLDYYLVRPVSSLFFLSVRDFAANSVLNVLIAFGILVWALGRYPEPLGWVEVVSFVVLLGLGTYLQYLVRMAFIVPVFWLHSARGLDEIAWSFHKLSQRPHRIYAPFLRWAMLTVIPVAFFGSFPAAVLFDGLTPVAVLHAMAVTAMLLAFVRWFWNRGLRAYSSASS